MTMMRDIVFKNRQGVSLAGKLHLPAGARRGAALFAHCFTCSKETLAAARVSQGLAMRGLAVLRFDFAGLGDSGGEFSQTSFASNLDDIKAAAFWMADQEMPLDILVGHSLGGAAVLAVAGDIDSVGGVATIGAPAEPAHVLHLLGGKEKDILAAGRAEVAIGGRPFTIGADFVRDLQARSGTVAVADLKADILIMHAPLDKIVGIENAGHIFTAAKHPKSFVSLDKADHLLTRPKDAAFAASVIAAWASRVTHEKGALPTASEGEVVVRSSSDGPFAHDIAIGSHLMRADEPPSIPGGLDSGPAPYDFLLAGLGACTAMTLRLYARRKGWPLEEVDVTLHHQKIHAEHAESGVGTGRLDQIRRRITLTGDLDEAMRQKLLEIADLCPVHRSLEAGIAIETEAVQANTSPLSISPG